MIQTVLIAVLAGGSVFCALMGLYSLIRIQSAKSERDEMMAKWVRSTGEAIRWSDSLADKLDEMEWAKRLAPRLERASIKLRPSEYGALMLAGGGLLIVILKVGMGAPMWMSLAAGTALTPIASNMFLKSRRMIYIRKIDGQLSEACRLLSSAARAGLSVPQGLEIVVQEMPAPIKNELATVVRELQLGSDLEVSLRKFLDRVNSKDIHVFVNALIIQRRAGGDLAKVLSEMASTMEERKIINKTIDASIAQARFSAYMLPVISALVIYLLSQLIDDFFGLFTKGFGIVLLAIFLLLQAIGFFLIKKIADIRV